MFVIKKTIGDILNEIKRGMGDFSEKVLVFVDCRYASNA